MNRQQAINATSPFTKEFYDKPLQQQLEFMVAWFMVQASTYSPGPERDQFINGTIDSFVEASKHIPKYVMVQCTTCENKVEVMEGAENEVNLCDACLGRFQGSGGWT